MRNLIIISALALVSCNSDVNQTKEKNNIQIDKNKNNNTVQSIKKDSISQDKELKTERENSLSSQERAELKEEVVKVLSLLKEKNFEKLQEIYIHPEYGINYVTYPGAHEASGNTKNIKEIKHLFPELDEAHSFDDLIYKDTITLEELRGGLNGLYIVGKFNDYHGTINYYTEMDRKLESDSNKIEIPFLGLDNVAVYPLVYDKTDDYLQCKYFYMKKIEGRWYISYVPEQLGCFA